MSLRGKRILITSGPTWVPMDSVRIISNIATGVTGMLLARGAAAQGAKVTLLLGSCGECNLNRQIRIIRFRFFNEFKNMLKRLLKNNKYDIIIHSAAVSDFKPKTHLRKKLSSGRAHSLELVPLEKLVILIRQLARDARLVMFKLESGVRKDTLVKRARVAAEKIDADLVIANKLNPYWASIIDRAGNQISAKNKKDLSKKLIKILSCN